jgi:hypothetical protein
VRSDLIRLAVRANKRHEGVANGFVVGNFPTVSTRPRCGCHQGKADLARTSRFCGDQ